MQKMSEEQTQKMATLIVEAIWRHANKQAEQESPKAKETISAQDNPVKSNNTEVADES